MWCPSHAKCLFVTETIRHVRHGEKLNVYRMDNGALSRSHPSVRYAFRPSSATMSVARFFNRRRALVYSKRPRTKRTQIATAISARVRSIGRPFERVRWFTFHRRARASRRCVGIGSPISHDDCGGDDEARVGHYRQARTGKPEKVYIE